VRLRLKDGRTLERTRRTIKGAPDDPMTEDEVFAKFRACLDHGFAAAPDDAVALQDGVMQLEEVRNVRDIVALFRACQSRPLMS